MIVRNSRSGTVTGNATLVPGQVKVSGLRANYIAAISGARADGTLTTSFVNAGAGGGTVSLPFDINWGAGTQSFNSLYIYSGAAGPGGTDAVLIETLTGSFVSGNIFPGDAYTWSTRSAIFYDPTGTFVVIPITGTLADNQTGGGGGGSTVVPLTGQLWPRGILTNR